MAGLSPLSLAMNPKDEQFFKALGARIASARKAHELTQQQLAEQLSIAQQTLAHYELTRTLGLSSDELLGQNVTRHSKRGPSSKLQQQIEAISQLPKARQRFVSEMLDTVLAQSQQ
jgi:DNA-binding XRE family transcriptional regulator